MTRLPFLRMNALSPWMLTLCLLGPVLPAAGAPSPSGEAPLLQAGSCSVEGLMAQIRQGLGSSSEAYKNYLRGLLNESAVLLPAPELQAAFERETDPALAEHLAAALVARTERGLESSGMEAVARRALGDANPAVRAATVRALRRTGALERTGDMYERLIRDSSPEVRQEAARNLVEDNREVYGGRDGRAADAAVMAASASTDPQVTAQILGQLETGAVGAGSARKLEQLLHSDAPEVRGAAATALGGVPATEMGSARESLLGMYRGETEPGVRKAILESIARLGFSSAVPELQRLRGVDPRLAPEVDAWIHVLGMDHQEWSLILREKQRLQQAR
ncbi:HEAT repeat domain-containing protein [Stigmatella sp. ncwal1]|uniref:HEAT repeat domain-containing protein n=1 Tax=Stigmatella ashevillensis TaxID=2995309 RepID=A0ABT5DKC4_9BACT|nr:HEAT repeat domain-containing protein [Stigmatella ashevillena]MDC0713499.1 HEAT repeat domain-containing protein [Stigmatella ashevillena]